LKELPELRVVFENGTKSKYLWIVLETCSHPSHSCHTAIIVRFSASLSAELKVRGEVRGWLLPSTEITVDTMGLNAL
jgi:hypothetical protein